jgi:hypothetical protein
VTAADVERIRILTSPLRSNKGEAPVSSENEKGRILYLSEARTPEPGVGWPQQELFLRVIAQINDESDQL